MSYISILIQCLLLLWCMYMFSSTERPLWTKRKSHFANENDNFNLTLAKQKVISLPAKNDYIVHVVLCNTLHLFLRPNSCWMHRILDNWSFGSHPENLDSCPYLLFGLLRSQHCSVQSLMYLQLYWWLPNSMNALEIYLAFLHIISRVNVLKISYPKLMKVAQRIHQYWTIYEPKDA